MPPVSDSSPLSGLDAAFLCLESLGTPTHVGGLMLLRRPSGNREDFAQRLRDHMADRVEAALNELESLTLDRPGLQHP